MEERRRFFLLFRRGSGRVGGGRRGSGGVTSATSTAGAARAFRRTERVAAGAGARDICGIRGAGLGVVLVVLAEGIHAAHRGAGALAAGVLRDNDVRGRRGAR